MGITGKFRDGGRSLIEAEFCFASAFIGAVTMKTVLGQNGADVAIEVGGRFFPKGSLCLKNREPPEPTSHEEGRQHTPRPAGRVLSCSLAHVRETHQAKSSQSRHREKR